MKRLFSLILCGLLALNLGAQNDTTEVKITGKSDTTGVKITGKNVVTIIEDEGKTEVRVGNNHGVQIITDDWGDTTHVRIGRRTFEVIEGGKGASVRIGKEERNHHWRGSFNPHWAGLEFGMNMYHQSDYSLYSNSEPQIENEFMDLHYGKSITVNLNFAEWAFKNEARNFGLVTGLGFSFMDFTFDRDITITKQESNDLLVPVDLESEGLKKTKLNVTYLTAPLMLEVKTPLRMGSSRLYLAAGVIGGVNIGSHTKYKYEDDKEKSRSNFNLNPFKYDLTGRIGFGDFLIFVNYGMTPMFKEDLGPELYPITFGFSFPNI